jgi:hypothetical protein
MSTLNQNSILVSRMLFSLFGISISCAQDAGLVQQTAEWNKIGTFKVIHGRLRMPGQAYFLPWFGLAQILFEEKLALTRFLPLSSLSSQC